MALTRSTSFETYAGTSGHQRDIIIEITQGSDTFYFSTRAMPRGLNSAPVYPLLISHSAITESIDIFTKRWMISDVNIELSDAAYYPQAGGQSVRASELLTDLNGEVINLYQWVDGITDIDDCLLIFSGYVFESPSMTKSVMRFTATDKSKLWDKTLPTRTVGEYASGTEPANFGQPAPIVYGKFNVPDPFRNDSNATGLCKAIRYNESDSYYFVADHATTSTGLNDDLYIDIGAIGLVRIVNDNSLGFDPNRIEIQNPSTYINFLPTALLPSEYDDETYEATDSFFLGDENSATDAHFYDNYSDNGSTVVSLNLFGIENQQFLRSFITTGGFIRATYSRLDIVTGIEGQLTKFEVFIYYGQDESSNDQRASFGVATSSGSGDDSTITFTTSDNRVGTRPQWGSSGDYQTEDPRKLVFAIELTDTSPTIADSTLDSHEICRMAESVIQWVTEIIPPPQLWAAANGLQYGATLTSGRSNSYGSSDVIEDPAFIIESIYREYIGLTDSEIDTDSFDNSENTSVKARINVTDFTNLSEVVRQLAEQSTIITHTSGAGGLRCINLYDSTPTTNHTISRNQLIDDDLRVTRTDFIINDMKVLHGWQAEYGGYNSADTYIDAASKTALQTRNATFNWQNIAQTSVDTVSEHYVNSTDGIWSKEHTEVEFTTGGFTHSHVQVGDWIELDSDVDDLRNNYGTAWGSSQLLVVEVQREMNQTTIRAIELY